LSPPGDNPASTVLPMHDREDDRKFDEAPPPFGGSWRTLYAIVAGALLVEILVFAVFTAVFR
jgi:hypothetical protein